MKSIEELIKEYIKNNNLSIKESAEKLGIAEADLENLDNKQLQLTDEQKQSIMEIIEPKPSTGKKVRNIIDLVFRFGACVMALVVLLLCINGTGDYKVLTVLLSIGLVCSSITGLPKSDK